MMLLSRYSLLVLVAAQHVSYACASNHADSVATLANRPDLRAEYRVFAVRCSKCHSLARPLNAGITDDGHWEAYVARMRRQPGSGISQADAVAILRFLHALAAEERHRKEVADSSPMLRAADGGTP